MSLPPPATFRIYFVIDFETGQTGSLLYYNKGGKKARNEFCDVTAKRRRRSLRNDGVWDQCLGLGLAVGGI
jgi:hypothetical protein